MIRKAALQIGVPALLAFMAWNAYLAVNHFKQMQKIAALTQESSMIQADISGVLKDLTDMETGQRGYLLTGNPPYLQPYSEAKVRIGTDLADIRVALTNRAESERSLVSQLESLANSKQAEMERSIRMRQQKLTSILSNQARSKTSAIEANARLLLENYGGFLPRQGHQYAEQIEEASAQMERLRQDLVDSPGPNSNGKAA